MNKISVIRPDGVEVDLAPENITIEKDKTSRGLSRFVVSINIEGSGTTTRLVDPLQMNMLRLLGVGVTPISAPAPEISQPLSQPDLVLAPQVILAEQV